MVSSSAKHVVVVGDGVSALIAACKVVEKAKKAGRELQISVVTKEKRLGGQIWTEEFDVSDKVDSKGDSKDKKSNVIVEIGAEGFVARSEIYPELAELVGLSDSLQNQMSLTDFELTEDNRVIALEAGEAARKLGFQVEAKHRGKGIRTFTRGMQQLVDAMQAFCVTHGVEFICDPVKAISPAPSSPSESLPTSGSESGVSHQGVKVLLDSGRELECDAAVLCVPSRVCADILPPSFFASNEESEGGEETLSEKDVETVRNCTLNSHVSVHVLARSPFLLSPTVTPDVTPSPPSPPSAPVPPFEAHGFTVPPARQEGFGGLRAVSLVTEKFPGRTPDGCLLFRCYFRPPPVEAGEKRKGGVEGSDQEWGEKAVKALQAPYPWLQPLWTHVARWENVLPAFSPEVLKSLEHLKTFMEKKERNIFLGGGATHGAGLEKAAEAACLAAEKVEKIIF